MIINILTHKDLIRNIWMSTLYIQLYLLICLYVSLLVTTWPLLWVQGKLERARGSERLTCNLGRHSILVNVVNLFSIYLVFVFFQAKLCKKFRVQGIPKFVLVDGETGQTITRDGYSHLMEDETGSEFPWRRKKFSDIIKGKLLKEGKEVDALEELKGKIVGLYFSAHWVSATKVMYVLNIYITNFHWLPPTLGQQLCLLISFCMSEICL